MKKIPLMNGGVAICDDEDYPVLSRFSWHRLTGGKRRGRAAYAGTRFTSRRRGGVVFDYILPMERLVLGTPPQRGGLMPDHRNRNPLDNRKRNLRWAYAWENAQNRWTANPLGKGVTFRKGPRRRPFAAGITYRGKRMPLGCYATAQEARDAYDAGAAKYHGEFACLNRDHWRGDA